MAWSGRDIKKWLRRNKRLRKRVQFLADRDLYLRDKLKQIGDDHKTVSERLDNEGKAKEELRKEVRSLETRLWKIENPPEHSAGDTAYPIIEDETRTDIPLLIIGIEYKGASSELLSRVHGAGYINESYNFTGNHWQYHCFDQNKKEECYYKEDLIGTCKKK